MSMQLKVLDQRHKQKLNLKALDAVLFGPPLRKRALKPSHPPNANAVTDPFPAPSHRSAAQLDEGLCPDGFHSDRRRGLLVRLHSEQVQQGAHLSDDEGPGEPAARRAEPHGPAESVRDKNTSRSHTQFVGRFKCKFFFHIS